MIDETGDRKDGAKTAHVGRQYRGSIGKIDNGVVSVGALWADGRIYYGCLTGSGADNRLTAMPADHKLPLEQFS